jgi:hypothetical protein
MGEQAQDARNLAMVHINSKSAGLAASLVLFFGGLGFFYVSILGGIVTLIIEIILWVVVFLTMGFGVILLPVYHVLLLIVAIILVNRHNKSLLTKTFGK